MSGFSSTAVRRPLPFWRRFLQFSLRGLFGAILLATFGAIEYRERLIGQTPLKLDPFTARRLADAQAQGRTVLVSFHSLIIH